MRRACAIDKGLIAEPRTVKAICTFIPSDGYAGEVKNGEKLTL